jgi:trehalose-phosphatase
MHPVGANACDDSTGRFLRAQRDRSSRCGSTRAVQRSDAGLIAQAFPAAFGAPFRAIAPVIQRLMGVDDLVVAGSHGFDIWSPGAGEIERQEGISAELLATVTDTVREQFASVKGALSSRRRAPFAVHYRLVDEHQRPRGKRRCRAGRRAERSTSDAGQDGVEIQPRIDWVKGRAVLYLLDALGLDEEDVLPL